MPSRFSTGGTTLDNSRFRSPPSGSMRIRAICYGSLAAGNSLERSAGALILRSSGVRTCCWPSTNCFSGRSSFLWIGMLRRGAVELRDLGWNQARCELALSLKLVEDDPVTVFVHVPVGYAFRTASASGAIVERTAVSASVTSVVLRRPTPG